VRINSGTAATSCKNLVLSRLDYGNAALVGLPVGRLQSVINAAARLVCNLSFLDHITDALVSLYWLRSPVMVKVAVLRFKTPTC